MSELLVRRREFISLMAVLMSLSALSIDAILPALNQIGSSLEVQNPNDSQLVISIVFLGMALGLMLYGPLSDSYGRKKAIYLGITLFLIGNVISFFADNLALMLIGRFCQGFGSASCRVVTLAMIRDTYEGKEMGKAMSLIMGVFILVPALAPSIGQGILYFSSWRAIFGFVFFVGLASLLWLHLRQPETLVKEKRLNFSYLVIIAGIKETLKNPLSRIYMMAAGIIFGSFVGYLSTAQQVLQIQYELGDSFALYFGSLALAIGFSSFINAKLVMKFRMEALCLVSLAALSVMSLLFFFYAQHYLGHPSLFVLMVYFGLTFFCFGTLFGNLNTLAVQPLGHIAGVATSVISSVQTLLSVIVGAVIGQNYDGTVHSLVLGFLMCGVSAFALLVYVQYLSTRPLS